MLLSSFVILHSPEGSSFPRPGSLLLHTGKGHSVGDRILSPVTSVQSFLNWTNELLPISRGAREVYSLSLVCSLKVLPSFSAIICGF